MRGETLRQAKVISARKPDRAQYDYVGLIINKLIPQTYIRNYSAVLAFGTMLIALERCCDSGVVKNYRASYREPPPPM